MDDLGDPKAESLVILSEACSGRSLALFSSLEESRVHPLLGWAELHGRSPAERENMPVGDLQVARDGDPEAHFLIGPSP